MWLNLDYRKGGIIPLIAAPLARVFHHPQCGEAPATPPNRYIKGTFWCALWNVMVWNVGSSGCEKK